MLYSKDTVQLTVNVENLNDNPPRFVENGIEVDTLVVTAPEEVAPPLNVYTFDVIEKNMSGLISMILNLILVI